MRKIRGLGLWALVVLSCASAGLQAQESGAAATAAGLRDAWVSALQQQDLEGSVGLFAQDALFVTPDGKRYPDRAAIRTLYRSVFQAYRSEITMTSTRQQSSDRLLVDDGTYTETLTEVATGKRLPLKGSYVLVWRRTTDGSWKITDLLWTLG